MADDAARLSEDIVSISVRSRNGSNTVVYLDGSVLSHLSGGVVLSKDLFSKLVLEPGQKHHSFPSTAIDITAESFEKLVDIVKGKPIMAPLRTMGQSECREVIDTLRQTLILIEYNMMPEDVTARIWERISAELEAHVFGQLNEGLKTQFSATLVHAGIPLAQIPFGGLAVIFSKCRNTKAAVLCAGLYHSHSYRSETRLGQGAEHSLTTVARRTSDFITAHLSYGVLLLALLLRARSKRDGCLWYTQQPYRSSSFDAVPYTPLDEIQELLGMTTPTTDADPAPVGQNPGANAELDEDQVENANPEGGPVIPLPPPYFTIAADQEGSQTFLSVQRETFSDLGLTKEVRSDDARLLRLQGKWPSAMGPCVQSIIKTTYQTCRLLQTGCSPLSVELPTASGACAVCQMWHSQWQTAQVEAGITFLGELRTLDNLDTVNQATFSERLAEDIVAAGEPYYVRKEALMDVQAIEALFGEVGVRGTAYGGWNTDDNY